MIGMTEEQVAFQMILHSGNARSQIIMALREFKQGNVEQCETMIEEAEAMLARAHKTHVDIIQKEAAGEKTDLSLLLIHAEDHLMSTTAMKELAKEFLAILKARDGNGQGGA